MAIRHLKHRYLIKEQFLEEHELNTSEFFSFSRVSDFSLLLWGFLLFGFIQISQMHDGKIIILFSFFSFLFRLGTFIVGRCPFDGDMYCFDRALLVQSDLCCSCQWMGF